MDTTPNNNPSTPNPGIIEERVVAEIRARRERGVAKYGVGMERSDLSRKQWLQHAKEEALDLAIYLEKLIVEIEEAALERKAAELDAEYTAKQKLGII